MTTSRWLFGSAVLAMVAMVATTQAAAMDLEPVLKKLQSVGPKGLGNREASRAWQQLAAADAERLPVMLAAMDEAGPLGDNWIRTAVDAVAERQLRSGGRLPADRLEQFVLDSSHDPRARRAAFEWLVKVDPTARPRLLAGMLDDTSLELRRDAVAQLMGEAAEVAELDGPDAAVPRLRRAFAAARDPDQVKLLAARLGKLGQAVDLSRHYGFILRWKLIGPFDNTGERGFDVVYPPEREFDPSATYQGKHGPVRWVDATGADQSGLVDLNKGLVEEKGVVGYAAAEFLSEKRQEVDLRVTSPNAVKFWLGGTLLAAHNVYHSGFPLDQYVARAVLQPGRNLILVKVCQNEQTQDWARVWNFKLRVCDALGGAVLSADRNHKVSEGDSPIFPAGKWDSPQA